MSSLIQSLRLSPRPDLQVPYVLVNYETTSVIDGISWMTPSQDIFPKPLPADPLAHFRALRATINLQGLQASTVTATLVCAPILADDSAHSGDQYNWWLARHRQFQPFDPTVPPSASGPAGAADPNNPITNFEIISGSVQIKPTNPGETLRGYPNELLEGQIAPWMNFAKQRVTISCKANIAHRNGQVVREHPLTYQCVATNAVSGTFNNQTITAFQEPTPVALAEKLFRACNTLQYEGELKLQEEEVSGSLSLGQLFNLTGGNLPEWESMNALVQSVTEDIDAGATTIEFGPPRHLSAGELVDLLRINRSRSTLFPPAMQTSGIAGGSNSVSLGNSLPEQNSSSTPGYIQSLVVSGQVDGSGPLVVSQIIQPGLLGPGRFSAFTQWTPSGPYALGAPTSGPVAVDNPLPRNPPGSVTISLADIPPADVNAGVFLKLRKLPICMNGTAGSMYFLSSQFLPD